MLGEKNLSVHVAGRSMGFALYIYHKLTFSCISSCWLISREARKLRIVLKTECPRMFIVHVHVHEKDPNSASINEMSSEPTQNQERKEEIR